MTLLHPDNPSGGSWWNPISQLRRAAQGCCVTWPRCRSWPGDCTRSWDRSFGRLALSLHLTPTLAASRVRWRDLLRVPELVPGNAGIETRGVQLLRQDDRSHFNRQPSNQHPGCRSARVPHGAAGLQDDGLEMLCCREGSPSTPAFSNHSWGSGTNTQGLPHKMSHLQMELNGDDRKTRCTRSKLGSGLQPALGPFAAHLAPPSGPSAPCLLTPGPLPCPCLRGRLCPQGAGP